MHFFNVAWRYDLSRILTLRRMCVRLIGKRQPCSSFRHRVVSLRRCLPTVDVSSTVLSRLAGHIALDMTKVITMIGFANGSFQMVVATLGGY